jgi:hypothetical protein
MIDAFLKSLEYNHLFAVTDSNVRPWRRLDALPDHALCGAGVTAMANIPGKPRCRACAVAMFEWLGQPLDEGWFEDDIP